MLLNSLKRMRYDQTRRFFLYNLHLDSSYRLHFRYSLYCPVQRAAHPTLLKEMMKTFFFWIVHDIACVTIKSRFSNSHALTLSSKWKFPFHFNHFEYGMHCCWLLVSLWRNIFTMKTTNAFEFLAFFCASLFNYVSSARTQLDISK